MNGHLYTALFCGTVGGVATSLTKDHGVVGLFYAIAIAALALVLVAKVIEHGERHRPRPQVLRHPTKHELEGACRQR